MTFIPDKRYYYTEEELVKIFSYIKKRGKLQHYALYKTVFLMGRRISEVVGYPKRGIIGLLVRDIDFTSGMITFTLEKRGKWEFTDLPDGRKTKKLIKRDRGQFKAPVEVLDILGKLIQEQKLNENDRVFPSSIRNYHKIFHRYLIKLGILDKLRILHGLRHSFGFMGLKLSKSGSDIRQIQKALGHTRLSTTEEYFKFMEVNEEEMMDKIRKRINI